MALLLSKQARLRGNRWEARVHGLFGALREELMRIFSLKLYKRLGFPKLEMV